jgi:predicted chitinase
VRFLIDECRTVDLVAVAGQAGHDAQHVAHVGKAGWKDWNVVRYARDGDFVLVTNNWSGNAEGRREVPDRDLACPQRGDVSNTRTPAAR